MKKIFIFFIYVCFILTKSFAGMYEVYNYKGYLDGYPIYITYQIIEETNHKKKIQGLYKDEKNNNISKIFGFIDNNKLIISEFNSTNKKVADFELYINEKSLKGIKNDLLEHKKLYIDLKLDSNLNDTNENKIFENVEILQTLSLKDFYFICVYSNKLNINSAQISKLKIVDKKTNQIFQIIDLSIYEQSFGNLMTIIYDNIDSINLIDNSFLLWGDIGRVGGYIEIKYNQKLNNFIVSDSIYIDGQ